MKTIRIIFAVLVALLFLPLIVMASEPNRPDEGSTALTRTATGALEVISTDRWETQFRPQLEGMYLGETPVVYLRRVLDKKIRPIDPIFTSHLEESLSRVLSSQWVDASGLPLLREGKVKGNYKGAQWQLTQLILRANQFLNGRAVIQYNKVLFNRLDNFDIALVLLDEALSRMRSASNQKDSYHVRKVVARLLARDNVDAAKIQKDLRQIGIVDFYPTIINKNTSPLWFDDENL